MINWKGIAVVVATLILLSACLLDPRPFDEGAWRQSVAGMQVEDLYSEHQRDGVFFNPWLGSTRGFGGLIRWQLSTKEEYTDEAEEYLPELIPELLDRIEQLKADKDFLVWIGHGTFLIRIDSIYFLTDPILSDRALLPKRKTRPAMNMEELAGLDLPLQVIISHNHYDHLDVGTIKALPEQSRIHVPLGLRSYVQKYHKGEVVEYDWWDEKKFNGWRLTSLPAQHWSRRIGQGRDTTLWASFMIEAGGKVIYLGGDSGYFIGFQEFGRLYPKIDYALMPTTAYHPRWFMHYPHMNVEEAVEAFEDLGADYFIPTQWGTFRLGDEPPGLAIQDLQDLIEERKLDEAQYLVPKLGEIVELE
ncbi:MBL fold metallo-hydrolase [Desulfosediminicola ganghwensis]|uniref:MBL fold metallo-hydrolase n=1 Tax=Desulfosediminicola ganghwensis TaxID=2569540 RepID=UPI0010ABA98A|nr:MBL fold metallo-hydrolase [Desulfosediminicola ganghwensis]